MTLDPEETLDSERLEAAYAAEFRREEEFLAALEAVEDEDGGWEAPALDHYEVSLEAVEDEDGGWEAAALDLLTDDMLDDYEVSEDNMIDYLDRERE